ncbi:MAG: CRISPR-associated protein Cas5 [Cyanobacteria bacterium]|nr:CRISPR-associated protein Cas5 [Cyanobacteriota bacterium]
MECLWLRIRAPFAAFRGFQAGVYRSTSPIMPPSAAFGLVLNLAGIEMRDSKPGVMTLIRQDLPCLKLAIGRPYQELANGDMIPETDSEVCTLYQQLHSYPVGNSGKELKERTHGAKFWITPVRRELLVGFDMILGVQGAIGSCWNVLNRAYGDNLMKLVTACRLRVTIIFCLIKLMLSMSHR